MTEQNAHFKSFSGRTEVYDCVQELLDKAKSEVRIMTTENGIVRMYKVREQTYRDLIGRGVDLQIALPITKDNLLFVSHFVEMGAVIKHLPEVARNRFINTDKNQVLAHLTETDDRELKAEQDYGVWTDRDEFVELTAKFFDHLWDGLIDYKKRCTQLRWGKVGRISVVIAYFIFVLLGLYVVSELDLDSKYESIIIGCYTTLLFLLGGKARNYL